MKVYIPFNMIVDIDFGIVRLVEKLNELPEKSTNKIKSFLLKRENENPILEYSIIRGIESDDNLYGDIIENHYDKILKLSHMTDLLSFVINTHKLGLSNEMEITIGCNYESDIDYLKSKLSSLNYTINMELNTNIKLDNFDYIFIKVLDEYYVDYLENNNIKGKRLYVADYGFNTLVDEESQTIIIDPELHLRLESMGNVVSTVSIYNKK